MAVLHNTVQEVDLTSLFNDPHRYLAKRIRYGVNYCRTQFSLFFRIIAVNVISVSESDKFADIKITRHRASIVATAAPRYQHNIPSSSLVAVLLVIIVVAGKNIGSIRVIIK